MKEALKILAITQTTEFERLKREDPERWAKIMEELMDDINAMEDETERGTKH